MCGPTAIALASFGIGAAKSVAGFIGQRQQFKAAEQFRAENIVAARQAAVARYASLGHREIQEGNAASTQQFAMAIEATQARSTAIAAASEGGVTGLSVDAIVNDYYGQQGRYNDSVDANFQMTRDYLRGEGEATKHQAIARINSVPIPERPGILPMLLDVATSATSAFSLNRTLQP